MFSWEIPSYEPDQVFVHGLNQRGILPSASWKLSAEIFGRTVRVSEMASHAASVYAFNRNLEMSL